MFVRSQLGCPMRNRPSDIFSRRSSSSTIFSTRLRCLLNLGLCFSWEALSFSTLDRHHAGGRGLESRRSCHFSCLCLRRIYAETFAGFAECFLVPARLARSLNSVEATGSLRPPTRVLPQGKRAKKSRNQWHQMHGQVSPARWPPQRHRTSK